MCIDMKEESRLELRHGKMKTEIWKRDKKALKGSYDITAQRKVAKIIDENEEAWKMKEKWNITEKDSRIRERKCHMVGVKQEGWSKIETVAFNLNDVYQTIYLAAH